MRVAKPVAEYGGRVRNTCWPRAAGEGYIPLRCVVASGWKDGAGRYAPDKSLRKQEELGLQLDRNSLCLSSF